MRETRDRVTFALRRPDLVWRRLLRQPVIDIDIDEIAPYLPPDPVIVEAGACDGADTVRMAQRWSQGTVHAFEPVPAAYREVQERVAGLNNVHTYELALSDRAGSATIHISEQSDGQERPDSSSLLEPTFHLEMWPTVAFRTTIEVRTVTLDDWAADTGVDAIDLLWLDLQGMELRVLKAAPQILQRTHAIHTELCRRELYRDAPLYDEVVQWLREQGFRVAIDRVPRVAGNALFVRDDGARGRRS